MNQDLAPQIDSLRISLDTVFISFSAFLVFFMQTGFAMLEVGSVRSQFRTHMVSLILLDLCLGVIAWWLLGYGFAYGTDNSGFIGSKYFAGVDVEEDNKQLEWLFQWVFALGATILSGSIAERVRLVGYSINSFFISSFVYPMCVHWGWSKNGWLMTNEYKDFAGSGIVHLCGGTIALVGAIVVGARKHRWDPQYACEFKPNNRPLVTLGTLVLWFGWYGFNCGSALSALDGNAQILVRAGINTTIAAASAGLTTVLIYWFLNRKNHSTFDVSVFCNGILAGTVGITASCNNVFTWAAFLIGVIASVVYLCFSALLKKIKVDDTIDASPVHFACGLWGVIAVGVFDRDTGFLYSSKNHDRGYQLGIQLLGAICIMAWSGGLVAISLTILKKCGLLRMSEADEMKGTDRHKINMSEVEFTAISSKENGDAESRRETFKIKENEENRMIELALNI